ncbi:uncharacterized protein LOC111288125 [Durio zibethinus]|uniref:Uncharacterized protein LOC111288125 n=1 Tax=Durio zibethinus TaxID=66656 RepID=A0A6P5Y2I2_DURZI|nr:uncharacterized protein LOC111288125 [Durio zibethinus]
MVQFFNSIEVKLSDPETSYLLVILIFFLLCCCLTLLLQLSPQAVSIEAIKHRLLSLSPHLPASKTTKSFGNKKKKNWSLIFPLQIHTAFEDPSQVRSTNKNKLPMSLQQPNQR